MPGGLGDSGDPLARGRSGAYLRGIARHLTHRHRRRFRRHLTLEELVDLAWSEEPNHGPDREAEATALADYLERLHQRLQAMLELRYREGLNASKIGTRFKISADAVRMSLSRGRQALGRCLAQHRAISA